MECHIALESQAKSVHMSRSNVRTNASICPADTKSKPNMIDPMDAYKAQRQNRHCDLRIVHLFS